MKIDIVSLFPEMYKGPFEESIIKRARANGLVEIELHNLRNWSTNRHKKVDDRPFGGGAGMVIAVEPVDCCLKELKQKESHVIALSAKGNILKQSKVNLLSQKKHLILLAGHYEGFDQRILDYLVDDVVSIGNFVVSGGELPSMLITDAIVRLIPGVLGNEESPVSDSFYEDNKTKQYPQYTRPAEYEFDGRRLKVPQVLLEGNHGEIEKWRNDKKTA